MQTGVTDRLKFLTFIFHSIVGFFKVIEALMLSLSSLNRFSRLYAESCMFFSVLNGKQSSSRSRRIHSRRKGRGLLPRISKFPQKTSGRWDPLTAEA